MRHVAECLLFLMIGFVAVAHATVQSPDKITYNGHRSEVVVELGRPTPLEVYFKITKKKRSFGSWSTGLYRGHIAVWQLSEGVLYLNRVYTHTDSYHYADNGYLVPGERDVKASSIFGRNVKDYPVQANWFTGTMLVNVNPYPQNAADEFVLLYLEKGFVKQHCTMNGEQYYKLMSGKKTDVSPCKEVMAKYISIKTPDPPIQGNRHPMVYALLLTLLAVSLVVLRVIIIGRKQSVV